SLPQLPRHPCPEEKAGESLPCPWREQPPRRQRPDLNGDWENPRCEPAGAGCATARRPASGRIFLPPDGCATELLHHTAEPASEWVAGVPVPVEETPSASSTSPRACRTAG